MVDRQAGIKISQFVQQSTIPAGALFTFVSNGTNITIPKEDLLAALGVTGTIVTAGAATATDVLQTVGSVNRIRGLEAGAGVIASLSAENGISLSHNFTQDVIGVPITADLALTSPTFASLLPGAGIAVTKVDDIITITATGVALPSTLTVTINQLSDFPTPAAGVITLVAGIIYIISNDVSTSNRFVLSENTSVIGHSLRGPTLTYTGSGTMFTGVDVGALFLNLHLNCPSAKVFDFSETVGGVKSIGINSVIVNSCDTIGDFDSLRSVAFETALFFSVATNGIVFLGTGAGTIAHLVRTVNIVTTNATLVAVDLGNSIADSVMIDDSVFQGVSGTIAIKGLTANGNLTATGLGQVIGNNFIGAMTPVDTINLQEDVQWFASNNAEIQDTRPDSLSTNAGGSTITIATVNTPVKIGGTWVEDNSAHFNVDGTGTTTYTGLKPLQVPLSAMFSGDPVSGSNKDFTVYFAIDGVVDIASGVPARASSGDRNAITAPWQHTFQPGETVEMHLENNTDAVNFNLNKAIMRID